MPQLEDDSFMDAVLGSALSLFLSPFEDSAGLDDFEDIAIESIISFFFFNLKSNIQLVDNFLSFAAFLYRSALFLCFYINNVINMFISVHIINLKIFSIHFLNIAEPFSYPYPFPVFVQKEEVAEIYNGTYFSFLGAFQKFRGGRSFHKQAAYPCRWIPGISQPLTGDTIDSGAVFERMRLDGIAYPQF